MRTLAEQLSEMIKNGEIINRVFFVDKCPSLPELEGCKCKLMSHSQSKPVQVLNFIDDTMQDLDGSMECIIAGK